MYGLDLFSGIGGLTVALSQWVTPVAYCENDRYAQAVLLSRMENTEIPPAPIWDDITTFRGCLLPTRIDIIYGGFPCQDISVAGRGKGLEGERSGLFFEIVRLVNEIQPTFIFLENVPAITTRGLGTVTAEITKLGYDCRWTTLSAAEIGANHKRERWWLLAHSNGSDRRAQKGSDLRSEEQGSKGSRSSNVCENLSDSNCKRSQEQRELKQPFSSETYRDGQADRINNGSWWAVEPDVGRVANGVSFRVDRIKCLGNAVVPLQAKEAFKILVGVV